MGSKPDFTQKLLHDLRLRKERMTGSQTSDTYRGSSRDLFKRSKGANTIQTIGQKNGSAQKSLTLNHTTTQQSVNQLVPYGGGHQSAQKGDISMAIACAFDNGGNLKAVELKSNAAMMNLLQQIGKISKQQTSTRQWQSTSQFPTLTHLHMDEVERGAQKLNQILTACTSGLTINKGSVEVGKELWKGATELEQSLRMLVSLQEASNCTIKPQRKSRLKLLEEGEDCDDDSSISIVKQKQVERPVFSFDKPSKNTKGSVQTDLQQKQQALKGDSNTMSEKRGPMISTGSHRRSASCGPELSSQVISYTKSKPTTARLPNVIAKLMGLDEIQQNAEPKPATEVHTWPRHRSGEIVSRTSHGSSGSTELKAEDTKNVKILVNMEKTESNKIGIVTANTHKLQEKKAYEAKTLDLQKGMRKDGRVEIRNCVDDSQEVIYQVNELQSQMIQPSGEARNTRNIGTQKQGIKHATETLEGAVGIEKNSSEVQHKVQTVSRGTHNTHETGERVAKKVSKNQQKKNMDVQLQQEMRPTTPTFEPQGKKLRTENASRHTTTNKSQQRKTAAHPAKRNNSQTATSHAKNLPKNQNARQNNTDEGCVASNTLLTSRQNCDPTTDSASANSKSLANLKSGKNGNLTNGGRVSQALTNLNVDATSAGVLTRKVAAEFTPERRIFNEKRVKANEIMAKTVRRQNPKKLEKLIVSRRAVQPSDRTTKCAQANVKPCDRPKQEKTQETKSEHMSTTNQRKIDDSHNRQDLDELPSSNMSELTASTAEDGQQLVADEAQEDKPQKIVTDDHMNGERTTHAEQQIHSRKVKQEPLTEDQINLKQKLIQSHLFLNTAEALFRLHIPIGILNYASDQINNDKNNNMILDCGYELLRRKGRRKEMSLYPNIGKTMKCKEVMSLDNLVRQMQEDFETLRNYGRNGTDEYNEVEYILKMLERDIFYRAPDLNCMWDLGWNETVFAYTEVDEVIRDMEQSLLDELLDEIIVIDHQKLQYQLQKTP
ncbi:uncharacterized protein LOC141593919 [Silene latifolia]|uniref:uncharacterized protein LOC141593919 n=1 Tax=Silene latifolia TaxID=37657 RepID=UPI003D77C077